MVHFAVERYPYTPIAVVRVRSGHPTALERSPYRFIHQTLHDMTIRRPFGSGPRGTGFGLFVAMDATSFKARLDASTAILAATRGRPNADAILANERKELLATLDGMEVSGMSVAQAIQDIKASGLPGEDEEVLISRIAELLSAPREARITSGGSSRGGCHNQGLVFQDFSTIPNFIPMVVWESCRHTQSGIPILKTAVALGLRRPTEPTTSP